MDKKSFAERMGDWWHGKATWFQKFCILFAFIVLLMLLVIFLVVMPPIWAIKSHKAIFMLLWTLTIGAFTAIEVLNDGGDIDFW